VPPTLTRAPLNATEPEYHLDAIVSIINEAFRAPESWIVAGDRIDLAEAEATESRGQIWGCKPRSDASSV
jgi:hypothetical protein